MQSGQINSTYTGLLFKGNPSAKAWDQTSTQLVDITIEPNIGSWTLAVYRDTEKVLEEPINDKMKIKIRDNFVHWTTLRDGTKVMYGVRMKDLAQAVKLNEELNRAATLKVLHGSVNERALRIKMSEEEFVSVNCRVDLSMLQVVKQLASVKQFDSSMYALSLALSSDGSSQSLKPSSLVKDLEPSSVLVLRRRKKTEPSKPAIEKPKTAAVTEAPGVTVEVTFPSSALKSFTVLPSILIPDLLALACSDQGLSSDVHQFDLPIQNISKIKLQQLRLTQLTIIKKGVPEVTMTTESTDSGGHQKYSNIKKPPPPPSPSNRRATLATPPTKARSPVIQAHLRHRSGSSPSSKDVNDAISTMLTQQAVGKATPTNMSLSPLTIKRSATYDTKKRVAPPPPPGKEATPSSPVLIHNKATPPLGREEVDGVIKTGYKHHGIPLPSMVKKNDNGGKGLSISPSVGRRQSKEKRSAPSPPPPPSSSLPPSTLPVTGSSPTVSRKPIRKAPAKPPEGNSFKPAPEPVANKPAPDPPTQVKPVPINNAPIIFKIPPPPPRKKPSETNKVTQPIIEDKGKYERRSIEDTQREREESEEDSSDDSDDSSVAMGYDVQEKDEQTSSSDSDSDNEREEPLNWQQYQQEKEEEEKEEKEEEKEREEEGESSDSSSDDDDEDDDDEDDNEDNDREIVLIAHKKSVTDDDPPTPLAPPTAPPPLDVSSSDPVINEAVHKLMNINEDPVPERQEVGGANVSTDFKELDNMVASLRSLIADTCEISGSETEGPPTHTNEAPPTNNVAPPPAPPPPPGLAVKKRPPPPVVKPKPKSKESQTRGSGPSDGVDELKEKLMKRQAKIQETETIGAGGPSVTATAGSGPMESEENIRKTSDSGQLLGGVAGGGVAGGGANDMQAQLSMLQQQMLQQQMMSLQSQFQQLQQQLLAGGGGGGGAQFNPLLMQSLLAGGGGQLLPATPQYPLGGYPPVPSYNPYVQPYTTLPPPPQSYATGAPLPQPIPSVTPPINIGSVAPPTGSGSEGVVQRERKVSEADRRSVALGEKEGQFDNLMEQVRYTKPDEVLNKVPDDDDEVRSDTDDVTVAISKAIEGRRLHLSTSTEADDNVADEDEWEENL